MGSRRKKTADAAPFETPSLEARRILSLLGDRDETGRDRSKLALRQARRRMELLAIDDFDAYVELLRDDVDERAALRRGLAAGRAALSPQPHPAKLLLEHVVPELRESAQRGASIRLWICRCGTGELAYSLAMMLLEQLGLENGPELRILATDSDDRSLEVARRGVFPASMVSGMRRAQLERFFERSDNAHYRARADLRSALIFAPHDAVRDPPFVRLDLLVSHGTLTDLPPAVRRKVLERFHYALGQGRFLLLDRAESAAAPTTELFTPLKPRLLLYRRTAPEAASTGSLGQLPLEWRPQAPGGSEDLAAISEEYRSSNRELVATVDELNRANADLASLLASSESVVFLDTDFRVKRCTPGAGALLHLGSDDVGRVIADVAGEFRDNTLIEDARLALQRFETVQRPVETRDGRWFSRRVLPYRSPSNPEIAGLLMTFTDISETLRARRAVAEKEYWRRLVDQLPVGAVLVADGRVHINKAIEQLTGYRRDDTMAPREWFRKLFGERADEMYELYEAHRRRGFTEPAVVTIRRSDGAERTVESWGAEYAGGEIHVLHDVTEKHELQRQVLDRVNTEQRMIGQELHDTVLQDLAALGLMAASLVGLLPPGSTERERAQRLAAGLGGLNSSVQSIAEGMLPLPSDDGDLAAALEAAAARTAARHGVSCRLTKVGDVVVDKQIAHELYRIAQEALTNVAKHSAARTAEVRLEQDATSVTLEIADDGIGIDPARRGAGLGTRIMRYRCELLGGRFRLERGAHGGTRVQCIVPRVAKPEAV